MENPINKLLVHLLSAIMEPSASDAVLLCRPFAQGIRTVCATHPVVPENLAQLSEQRSEPTVPRYSTALTGAPKHKRKEFPTS